MNKQNFLTRNNYRLVVIVQGRHIQWSDWADHAKISPVIDTPRALVDFASRMVTLPDEIQGKLTFGDVLHLAEVISEFKEVA